MDDFDVEYQILQSHLNSYKEKKMSLLGKMLFYKLEGSFHLFYGQVRPIFDDDSSKEEKLEYHNILYLQKIITYDKIDNWVRGLMFSIYQGDIAKDFIFGDQRFCSLAETSFQRESYNKRWLKGMRFHPLCRTIFTKRYPSKTLNTHIAVYSTNPNLSYYPSIKELILHKFGFNTDSYSPNNNLHIALVPLSGYISKIYIDEEALKLDVKNKESLPLTLKVYGETKTKQCETFNFHTSQTDTFSIPLEFSKVNVILVNQDGILLDTREFFKKEKTLISEIDNLIFHGETETVDFKLWNPDIEGEGRVYRRKKLAILLTAFANTNGGKILFGVSDESEIIGIRKEYLDEIDKFLTNICDAKTRPRVQVQKDFTEIEGKIIGIFTVEKSPTIVQNLYNKHYYIRRGSTNRIMRPEEIVSYQRKEGW